MAQRREEEMVVMFPFMAQGHIIPFLTLALQIEQRFGYKIIFVNTPLNIKKLHSSLPPNSSISLIQLPYCSTDHGLPPDSENTDTLSYPLICNLLTSTLSLKPYFEQLILDLTKQQGHPPLCIIADLLFGWTVDIANDMNIFHAIFNSGGAYGMGVYYSVWMNLPHTKTDSDEFTLPDFPEVSSLHRSQLSNHLRNANGKDSWSKYIRKYLPLCFKSDGILLNTIEELDQTGLKYFRRNFGGRPVWPILPAFMYQNKFTRDDGVVHCIRSHKKSGIDPEKCIEWLDNWSENSVLFVSFGSQNTISSSQMMELAIGLETSGKNFIWVVRPPVEFNISEEFRSEWLPTGYEDRIKKQNIGLIVHKWAPQLEILSHKSTCAFVSHCGWNSILESLSHGVPILGWPLSGEQHYNSKFLEEEVGVCVEIGRGTTGEVKNENIKKAIGSVMGGSEKAREMRKKAFEVKEMIKNAIREDEGFKGGAVKAIEDFFSAALSTRK
ncbi:Udp-glycosyltransferase 92a1 [Thalictrum thalictroides]|uniref:Glycosyltransferase n=1 Tax=Thalictrum thalictroides TaxID=46969 RepID=A0A7J6VQM4_THATH|nr:Udp-glycosyltransferase 92a1 [Thalictrum thalictroides]